MKILSSILGKQVQLTNGSRFSKLPLIGALFIQLDKIKTKLIYNLCSENLINYRIIENENSGHFCGNTLLL